MKVSIVTPHLQWQPNKTSIHHICIALQSQGIEVSYVTSPFSLITVGRLGKKYGVLRLLSMIFKQWRSIDFSLIHPAAALPVSLQEMLAKSYRLSGMLRRSVASSDVIIVDTSSTCLGIAELKGLTTKLIYRASDIYQAYGGEKWTMEMQELIAVYADKISCPSKSIQAYFNSLDHHCQDIVVELHGVNARAIESSESPFTGRYNRRAVFVGISHLDLDVLAVLAESNKDWIFYIVGMREEGCLSLDNIIWTGLISYEETLGYMRYCDVCLAIRKVHQGCSSFSHSLKIMQYMYCKKPIVGPAEIFKDCAEFFTYDPFSEESIKAAFNGAKESYDINYPTKVLDWQETSLNIVL